MDKLQMLIPQVQSFVKVAVEEIEDLKYEVTAVRREKVANELQYQSSVEKIASVLYDADILQDSYAKADFVKAAAENPAKLASMIEKVVGTNQVLSFGSPYADTTTKTAEYAFNDPIARRAFGLGTQNSF